MRYLCIVICAALSGCAIKELQTDMRIERYSERCEKIGWQKGTDQHRECVTQHMAVK